MENVRGLRRDPGLQLGLGVDAVAPGATTEPDFQLSDVIAGTYDAYIAQFAAEAQDWGHPFFLRFNWEMNGNWFPWSEGVNGNNPGEYVAAWRHVHDIFAAVGATNATWVWCPYADANKRSDSGTLGRSTPATRTSTGPAWTATTGAKRRSTRTPGEVHRNLRSDLQTADEEGRAEKPLLLG